MKRYCHELESNIGLYVFFPNPVLLVCVISVLATYHIDSIIGLEVWILASLSVCLFIFAGCVVVIYRQPQSTQRVSFMVFSTSLDLKLEVVEHKSSLLLWLYMCLFQQVPFLPFLPVLSIFVNIYLMVQLSGDTWIRFSVWMALGKSLSLKQGYCS